MVAADSTGAAGVAYELAERVDVRRTKPAWPEHLEPVSFPRVAGGSDPVVQWIAVACSGLLRRPLLLPTFAPASEHELLGGRPALEVARELAELPDALTEVEASLRAELHRLHSTAELVAVASDTTMNRLADCVLDLHLARLRAIHLAEILATSDDIDRVC